jgi:hypothetical protein
MLPEFDIDELLSLIEEDDEVVTPEEDESSKLKRVNSRVLRFIKEKDVKTGGAKIPTFVVYYHYAMFAGVSRVGKTEFFRTFGQYFEQKRTKNQRFYLLDPELNLSREETEQAKKFKSKRKTVRGKK